MRHDDDEPVRYGYSSSRNISFRSPKAGEELGITRHTEGEEMRVSRLHVPPSDRVGATKTWVAAIMPTRLHGKVVGLYIRIGSQAIMVYRI
jgi:hypothetical protein